MAYPEAVENAARELAPHLIAFYLKELAADFHSYYNATRILVEEERREARAARARHRGAARAAQRARPAGCVRA